MPQGRPKNDPGQPFSGEALKIIAQARNFTSSEIARIFGCSTAKVSTWYRFPNGVQSRPPQEEEVAYLSKLLSVPAIAFSSVEEAEWYAKGIKDIREWLG